MSRKARRAAWCAVVFFFALACAFLLLLPQWLDKPLLFAGAQRYTFFSGSASSQARITVATPEEAPFVRLTLQGYTGESAYYPSAEDAFAQAEAYGARLLFCERAGDVTDCYSYSPRLGGCVYVGGYAVNLHIALRQVAHPAMHQLGAAARSGLGKVVLLQQNGFVPTASRIDGRPQSGGTAAYHQHVAPEILPTGFFQYIFPFHSYRLFLH